MAGVERGGAITLLAVGLLLVLLPSVEVFYQIVTKSTAFGFRYTFTPEEYYRAVIAGGLLLGTGAFVGAWLQNNSKKQILELQRMQLEYTARGRRSVANIMGTLRRA